MQGVERATAIVNIDDTDRAILKYLIKDARASVADIARDLGVQRDTVKYRIERFEKRGLIMKYHTFVDPIALGMTMFMILMIKVVPAPKAEVDEFLSKLNGHKNVTHISRLVGKYDYMVLMAAEDIVAFDVALDEVKSIKADFIIDIELSNHIDEVKVDDFTGLV